MAEVVLNNIGKAYGRLEGGKGLFAVRHFTLTVADGEFVVIVGPSGCGKSTTLNMIAGLEDITEGDLYLDGRRVNDVSPQDRDIAMVFQSYALYPHMTVYGNLSFALKLRKVPRAEIDKRVRAVADILGIAGCLDRKPKALSGGQRQRVAIGRAIVREPKVFLMDEPLSNLDAALRSQMRAEILKLRQRLDATFIYVTHDQTEAMTLGDRIVVMKDGAIQQMGTPREVYEAPASLFVATFIGAPQMNLFEAELRVNGQGEYSVALGGASVPLSDEKQDRLRENKVPEGKITLGIRPEHLHLRPRPETAFRGRVEVAEMLGGTTYLHIATLGTSAVIVTRGRESFRAGDEVDYGFEAEFMHLFDRETGRNCEI